uniref:Minor capsid protein P9 transmembrane helices domain-containing protein n=1 Tax=viral metagenome TaxID=1070528 RepID=A0A6C0LTV0_9ZZZZ
MSVSDTIDYSPNSFGKMNVFDKRFNLDDPFRPKFASNNNFVLLDMAALNDADADAIMDTSIYESKKNPMNLLNDPVLNKAISSDATVNATVLDDAILMPPKRELLVDIGNHNIYGNVYNNPVLYEQFLDGSIDQKLYKEYVNEVIDNPNLKTIGAFKSDKFWLEDPSILFSSSNYYKIIPTGNMSKIEILNSLTRFFIYITVLYILLSDNLEFVYIPIIGLIIIMFIYFIQYNDPMDQKREKICKNDKCNKIDVCQKPTRGNPFMNLTMKELMDNRDRAPGCISTDKIIKNDIDYNFNYNLFKDVDDIYDRGYSQRQFYTTPSTTLPNDQTGFAKWLYKIPETCKENQMNCLKYEDLRFNRFNPNIDRIERIKEELI